MNVQNTTRCLCYRHMRDYRHSRRYIVQRTEVYTNTQLK